jgi:hypothetical protein
MSIRTANRSLNGRPSLFINDKGDNPIGINMIIGKRPLAAFGTFEGVREMLEYTGAALNDFSIYKKLLLPTNPPQEGLQFASVYLCSILN